MIKPKKIKLKDGVRWEVDHYVSGRSSKRLRRRFTKKIDGDIAEVGTYRGGSAKLICEAKGEKKLHLFDTFEGFAPADSESDDEIKDHRFRDTSIAILKEAIGNLQNIVIKKQNLFIR